MSLPEDQSHLDNVRKQLESVVGELNTLLGKDGSGAVAGGSASSQFPKHIHFKIFRDYIEHEDELVNQRLLWNINIQGFLFASYGFSVQKLAEVQVTQKLAEAQAHLVLTPETTGITALRWFMVILPLFGIFISVLSFKGVRAAQYAIRRLSRDWEKAVNERLLFPLDDPLLPGMIGGGYKKGENPDEGGENQTHIWGFLAPLWFPRIFIAAWLFVLISYLGPLLLLKFGKH